MPTPLFALIVLAGAALYFMTPAERKRLALAALSAMRTAVYATTHPTTASDPFSVLMRERTRWVVATPLLVVAHVLIFAAMVNAPGAMADPQTAIDWGANFAPRTTNNEWHRLLFSTFVHAGLLHLIATIAGLLPVGLVLERIVGPVTFAAIYCVSGLLASVVSLWTADPMQVTFGPSGAIFGIYGLLLAVMIWVLVERPAVPVPVTTIKRVAGATVPFLLYSALTEDLGPAAELTGLGTGVVAGLIVARGVTREKPVLTRAAVLAAVSAVLAIGAALPLRGVTDFRPHLAQIAAVEERTVTTYDAAVSEFRLGRLPAKRLAQLIDRTILPDLQGVQKRVSEVRGVPREQAPMVEAANAYLRLREQSWRRRAEGLLRANLKILQDAERTERSALEAFNRLGTTGSSGSTAPASSTSSSGS